MTTPGPHPRPRRLIAGAVMAAVAAFASAFLAAPPAAAFTYPDPICNGMACSYQWCPGMPLPMASAGTPNWDMNAWHRFMIGQISANSPAWVTNGGLNRQVSPMVIEGDPGPCPGCVS
ncbi:MULTISPECIES: hypothetical protein [unclassified Mycobacterium]|uniref:hypothetical protein n=1 Tax=unclassified Mycobacterium TaxID=2642494 RepID=UPI0012E8C232|nr:MULTISPECIES: hypothetical protein [unclassified Mycobacterium]